MGTAIGYIVALFLYLHGKVMCLIDVKSYADYEDVEWFYEKAK
jgi:hypothetical protein